MSLKNLAVLTLGLTSLLLWPWWLELWRAWQSPLMWHGPIAFGLGGFLAHRCFSKLPDMESARYLIPGMAAAAGSLFSLWVFNRYFLSIFLWLLACWLLVGGLKGREMLKDSLPAFLMPVFGLPLLGQSGFGLLAIWVDPLSRLVAAVAAVFLKLAGLHLIVEGPRLFFEGAVITVGLHCAGIQYFEVLGLLVLLSISHRGFPRYWPAFFITLVVSVLLVNSLRVFAVAAISLKIGMDWITTIDQITGISFLFLLLPILWKWPVIAGTTKPTSEES